MEAGSMEEAEVWVMDFQSQHTSWIPCEVCLGLATLEFNVHADTADM
jgi:hypothetical protein